MTAPITVPPESLADVRAFFQRVRALAEEGLARLDALAPVSSAPDILYMTLKEYAERRRVGEKTVRRWLGLGLPHFRSGKTIRVRVKLADEWEEPAAVRRSAENEAAKPDRRSKKAR